MIEDGIQDTMRYDIWVEQALRQVIRDALSHVAEHGLPGDHHFYISFMTQDPGVQVPGHLRAQHPGDMTIVLQYQYEDLKVADDHFEVSLSFGGIKEHLVIPYSAVISFADPSVNFALQLKMSFDEMDEDDFDEEGALIEEIDGLDADKDLRAGAGGSEGQKTGEVIALDAFRKK